MVSMSCHRFGFVTEENAFLGISVCPIVAEEIVRIFVADGDAGFAVVKQVVVFEDTVFYSPA